MDLILVRHGLPQTSRETSDPPLSDTGRMQARRVAAFLEKEDIHSVWSSTMKRAVETAQPLAGAVGLDLRTHHGICEYDKAGGEYIPDEVLRAENPEAWKAMAANGFGYDMAAFQGEVVDAMEQIVSENLGGRVAVFCHGGVINVWTAHVLGLPVRLFFEPTYASVNRFRCSRGGVRSVVSLNEHAHVRGD